MEINLIRICSPLHKKNKALKTLGDNLIEDINNDLINDDILLLENAKNPTFSILMIESGGSEEIFKSIIDKLEKPIILFCTNANNSLAASLEIRTYCYSLKIPCYFLFGEQEMVTNYLSNFARSFYAYKEIKGNRLAVIGGISEWLIASQVDYMKVKDIFDVEIIDITKEELYDEINKHKLLPRLPKYDEVLDKYGDKEEVDKAYNIYSALKRLIKKYDLSGFTLKCFDLVSDFKTTACLALALLNDEGITAACEGDVPTMITMHLVSKLTDKPCFMANPSKIDLKNMEMILSHCTVPLTLTDNYSLMTHFESGLGIGIRGNMPAQEITILKIAPNFDKNEVLCVDSKIKENLSLPNFCRTQIKVELNEESVFALYREHFANHVVVCYSDITNSFMSLLQLYYND